MKIALDAMGGDFAPQHPVAGALQALKTYDDLQLVLVGDQARIEAELKEHSYSKKQVEILHASQTIEMNEAAVESIRRKKDSSISRCIDLIKSGSVDAAVSAGHTGAAVAGTKIKLRTLPGIARPAIATVMPTENHVFLLVDAGANTDSEPEHLAEFAIMGSIYAQDVLGMAKPRVGLLSNGKEESKGNELTRAAYELLSKAPIHFIGNVEGHDLFSDPPEVVVCDGFVGNLVLKSCESLATGIFGWLKKELKKNPLHLAGAWVAKDAFREIKKKTNTDEYGGMPLLGINGTWIKAHGNASPKAIKNALRVARESVQRQINPRIAEVIAHYHATKAAPAPLSEAA